MSGTSKMMDRVEPQLSVPARLAAELDAFERSVSESRNKWSTYSAGSQVYFDAHYPAEAALYIGHRLHEIRLKHALG